MWEVGEGVIVFVMRANVIRANDGWFIGVNGGIKR